MYFCIFIFMADRKDWLAMTRHERRGALALVLLAVMVVVAVFLMRTRTHQLTPAEQLQMRQFELVADSLHQAADSAKHATKTKQKAKTRPGSHNQAKGKQQNKNKSQNAPSRMDPVPQF